jgi:hypothetical protein
MKAVIFQKTNLLGNSQFQKCSVSNEIPAAYRGVIWAEEKEAFRWRANKEIRTKIELIKGIAIIKIRMVIETKNVSFDSKKHGLF